MSDNFNVIIMRVYFGRAKWGNSLCSRHISYRKVRVFLLLTKWPSIIFQIESLHRQSWIFGIHSLTLSHIDGGGGDGATAVEQTNEWTNKLEPNQTRNMKLSIFDQSVYIRSLKLNGSTFNAYFKRFDRCETTFIWTKQSMKREWKNITIPRRVLQKADDITNIESTRHFIFPKKNEEEIKHTRLNLCCAQLNITRLTKETTIQIMKLHIWRHSCLFFLFTKSLD